MIAVLQRVSSATVTIGIHIQGQIGRGLMVLLGVESRDTDEDVDWLTKKIMAMRIFSDPEGRMNLSCQDVDGGYLIVSQFTLHASTKKGNRPSFIAAARPEQAIPLYELFIERLGSLTGKKIESGEFGADMQVALVNDGPVTILIDSQDRR